ncbi:hypothetical protein [Spirillospora sp. CA-128828]|uniref:hypothetical protein n=1 Tax=Spirillospora sp. CA-128828 TaxID=3240033 RepID=UPI003D8BA85E
MARSRPGRALAGRLCPNAPLDGGRRFDDVAAGRFAIVTATEPSAGQRAEIERRGAVVITTGPGDALDHWLRRGRVGAAIVRPDGTVLRAGRLSALHTAVPAFGAMA